MWPRRAFGVSSHTHSPVNLFRYRLPRSQLFPTARQFSTTGTPQYRFGSRTQYQRFQKASNVLFRWAQRPTFYREVGLLSGGAGLFYWYNLEEVPISGRRRFNIISPELEASVSQSAEQQVKQQFKGSFLPPYDPRVKLVRRVLQRLIPFAEEAGLVGVEWEVNVIDDPTPNAFVIPGGKVFVFTGILPFCKGEDGVAAVLGHEIAHVVAHHPAERISKQPLVWAITAALLLSDWSFQFAAIFVDLIMSLPGSRKQEAEADYIGLMMMARGCYNPEAALDMWNSMEVAEDKQQPPQFLSTHPSNHNRGAKIREWLPKAHELQQNSECHVTSVYADQFARAWDEQSSW